MGTGRSDKNDPNDARSVAIAALRAAELVPVRVEDHASVLRGVSRRHTQLGWFYNKSACRLRALVADLVPGGISKLGEVVWHPSNGTVMALTGLPSPTGCDPGWQGPGARRR